MKRFTQMKFIRLKAILLILSFSSCIEDTELVDSYVNQGTKTTFVIDVPRSPLPSTRAITDGSEDDNIVNEVTILLFDKTGGAYSGSAVATEITTDATNSYKKTFTVILPDGEYNTLVLANANDIWTAFQAAHPGFEDETLSFFEENLTTTIISGDGSGGYVPWNSNPGSTGYKPFPMAGRFELPATRGASLGTIYLTRMLAKINVKLAFVQSYTNDPATIFRINSILVPNFSTKGNLIPGNSEGKTLSVFDATLLNIPTAPGNVSGEETALTYSGARIQSATVNSVVIPAQQCVDGIFVPEKTASADDVTCLLLEVYHPERGENRWFHVDLRMPNAANANVVEHVHMLRNFRYTVNITDIAGNGFSTAEEAYNAPAEGMTTEITAIDESDMNDITFDGRNQLTVNKSNFLFYASGDNQELKIFTDYTLGWEIESASASWFHISASNGQGGVTAPTTLSCDAYTGNTVRSGEIVITAGPLRKTIRVVQVPDINQVTTDATPPTGFNRYVGAFWRSNQTGERLIRIARPTISPETTSDGAWMAVVLEGKDWIQLDTVMTADPNVGWLSGATEAMVDNGNDAGFDSRHQLPGNQNWVGDTLNAAHQQIYFRIGLNGHYNPTDAKPARYGVVLLAYNNYTKLQRIWIRQGEEADYLMSNEDPVSSGGITVRTACVRFLPYNLTATTLNAPVSINGATDDPIQPPAILTDYPSQAGAYWQWASTTLARYAWSPVTGDNTNWSSASVPATDWTANISTNETCPEGYRRPTAGPIVGTVPTAITTSESHQSLWQNPQLSEGNNTDNYSYGYYADGFFDRRQTGTPGGIGTPGANSAVALNTVDIAYRGGIFFNKTTYASLFLPLAGFIETNNTPYDAGTESNNWTSSCSTNASYPRKMIGLKLDNIAGINSQMSARATSIRCVKDEPIFRPTNTVDKLSDTSLSIDFIPYAGAFWRADQTGERLIRIPRPTTNVNDGIWEAQVIEGKDWITLDTLMTTDLNVGWRTDVTTDESQIDDPYTLGTTFDSKHAVVGGNWFVRGMLKPEAPEIYFRIGLKSKYTPTVEKPVRYGVVLLSYANGTKVQRIWIRQGEEADFIQKNTDPVSSGGLTVRTACVRIAPYNLTAATLNAPVSINGATDDPALPPAIFTHYPSQAGAYWQWASNTRTRYAWSPVANENAPNWDTAGVPATDWDTNAAINESCPDGYRRPNDGPTNATINSTNHADISQSEFQQSLWPAPFNGGYTTTGSFVSFGYYADGFFDRRTIGELTPGSGEHNVVLPNTAEVAYRGVVFVNPMTCASLFFPFSSARISQVKVEAPGSQAAFWTSASSTISGAASTLFFQNAIGSSTGERMSDRYKNNGASLRCVKE